MKKIVDCEIKDIYPCHYNDFVMLVHSQELNLQTVAGQFAQILVEGAHNTYLRRPISICDADIEAQTIAFYIRIVGDGTAQLSRLQKGDFVNIIYPLGNGFSTEGTQKPLLIGGGCGIAPLLLLAKALKKKNIEPVLLVGGQTENALRWMQNFDNQYITYISTDDGSLGEKGLVTQNSILQNIQQFDKIYTCGPEAMMKSAALLAAKSQIECEVSLENTMACGIGACLCCVTKTVEQGNVCVCTEGPVFNSKFLINYI
ncbi:MAG: dihydroorotate dehydrogenase electron transfer subunit [Bacteroidales bacterium]|jgi:dihydroorotate dehydrogenase electron transfer subunit|nr:dihydroorotate dehydrogenase electron transfer subunit [Bacteroidales bacterium]